MGFFSGRLTYTRFRVSGKAPRQFGPEFLEKLSEHAIGTQRVVQGDGSTAGWIAGDHILDTKFDLAKNIINDALYFALRIDELKMPSDLLRAYTQVELTALAAQNPSGMPSARQKREARQLAREKLESEARDGRYTRRKFFPILWDANSNEMLVGATSAGVLDRLVTLFYQTFDRKFDMLSAGAQAFSLAEIDQTTKQVDDAQPTSFITGEKAEIAWAPDENNRDFLGNEFLLWLWYFSEKVSDSVNLSDESDVAIMPAQTLVLECPRGQTGKETITSDAPTRLPEAHRAIQSGKLPRRMGLTLVRHDTQYDLTLQAENLAICSAKLPAPEGDQERARLEDRVTQVRHLAETTDLLYQAFLRFRLSSDWGKETAKIKKWLRGEGEQ